MRFAANNPVRAELVEAQPRKSSFALRLAQGLRANGIWSYMVMLLMIPALSACSLQPLYTGGASGTVASTLEGVSVDAIEGKSGWLMRNALTDRLSTGRNADAKYQLIVKLDDTIEGLGVRSDDTVTRERRTLRARYQLVELATGKTVLDATAGSDAGIDVVSSEYATIAGENTALENLSQTVADQIVARLALYARQNAAQNAQTRQ